MKRTKIGDIDINYQGSVFTLGENFNEIRQNQVVILSYMGKYNSRINNTNILDVENKNNDLLDDYYILYNLIEYCNEKLENVMYNYFNYVHTPKQTYFNINERNEILSLATNNLIEKCNNDIIENLDISEDDYLWFKENILNLNYYLVDGEKYNEKQNIPNYIGGSSDTDILNNFLKCGYGYLYGCVDKQNIDNSTKTIKVKYLQQKNFYTSLTNLTINPFPNETSIKNYVKTSCQNTFHTSESSNEIFLGISSSQNNSKIGFVMTAELFGILVITLAGLISKLIECLVTKSISEKKIEWEKEKYYDERELATELAESSAMGQEDFLYDKEGNLKSSNLFLILAVALGIYFIA